MTYKAMVSYRKDWFYCPLPLGADSYGNCEYLCPMCYCRDLDNRIWKKPFRPGSLENFKKAFKRYERSGITLKLGNKSDPYPPSEEKLKVTRDILKYLKDVGYPFFVNTRGTGFLRDLEYIDYLFVGMLIGDRPAYEGSKVPPAEERWRAIREAVETGVTVSINAEPLIKPTKEEIDEFVEKAAEAGVYSVNFYSFNFTHWAIENVDDDLVDLYDYNQTGYIDDGKYLIQKLRENGIKAGVPDWISFPFENDCLTCCGFEFESRNKLSVFELLRILREKKRVRRDDVLKLTDNRFHNSHWNFVWKLWGSNPNQREYYFLDDLENVKYNRYDDCYEYVEVEKWW